MFCACSATFGDPPNTNVCPVCLGLPGALPVPNAEAVRLGAAAALALGCTVHRASVFARKNYFYPDLPKGYQISQFDQPLATGGRVTYESPERGRIQAGITRLHLEEDAGKLVHDRFPGKTAVDLNRAGVPLAEIVSEPDLRSPGEARAYLTTLRQILVYAGASECSMEKGSLRVAANHATSERPADRHRAGPLVQAWEEDATAAFLKGYRLALALTDNRVLPSAAGAADRLIGFFVIEKALYELRYEMGNRPDWLSIPLFSLIRTLEDKEEHYDI
jgi:Asp-tRNA(Asn)/Glu-tRNA(Gln) amidotransferase B subunit